MTIVPADTVVSVVPEAVLVNMGRKLKIILCKFVPGVGAALTAPVRQTKKMARQRKLMGVIFSVILMLYVVTAVYAV